MYYGIQSEDEREMCARTIYCTNIDKKVFLNPPVTSSVAENVNAKSVSDLLSYLVQVTQADVKLFFESICGEVCIFF